MPPKTRPLGGWRHRQHPKVPEFFRHRHVNRANESAVRSSKNEESSFAEEFHNLGSRRPLRVYLEESLHCVRFPDQAVIAPASPSLPGEPAVRGLRHRVAPVINRQS